MNVNLRPNEPSNKEFGLMKHGEYFECRYGKADPMQVAVYLQLRRWLIIAYRPVVRLRLARVPAACRSSHQRRWRGSLRSIAAHA